MARWASDVTDASLTGNGLLRYACAGFLTLGLLTRFLSVIAYHGNGNLIVIDNRVKLSRMGN